MIYFNQAHHTPLIMISECNNDPPTSRHYCSICMDVIDSNSSEDCQIAPCGFSFCLFHKHCLYAFEQAQREAGLAIKCPHCNVNVDCVLMSNHDLTGNNIGGVSRADLDVRRLCDHIRNLVVEIMERENLAPFWHLKLPFVYTSNGLLYDEERDCRMTWNVVACIVELLHAYVKPDVGVWIANNVDGDASMRTFVCCSNKVHNEQSFAYEFIVELQRVAYIMPEGNVKRHAVSHSPFDGYELTLKRRRMCRHSCAFSVS